MGGEVDEESGFVDLHGSSSPVLFDIIEQRLESLEPVRVQRYRVETRRVFLNAFNQHIQKTAEGEIFCGRLQAEVLQDNVERVAHRFIAMSHREPVPDLIGEPHQVAPP